MKISTVSLLSLFLHIHCGSLAKLELRENEAEPDEQRSTRVHRVADYEFAENNDSMLKSTVKDIMIKQAILLGSQELEKLLVDFPNVNNLVQREMQLFKELNTILREMVRDGTISMKSIDHAISEMMETSTSSRVVEPVSKNDNGLWNLLNSSEKLDVYQENDQINESRGNKTSQMDTTNDLELKTAKNIAKTLDNVMMDIQNHITFVRNVFEKLCRKHHSVQSTQSNESETEESKDQPKKVSILQN
ncbi:unnamed protein product [Xylocopa violacea]|uniref:Uncharacterized protein n=1 Tax=Xylocopa violacea TaxID=135666 RepID=A0ABP1NIS0_XYLVO